MTITMSKAEQTGSTIILTQGKNPSSEVKNLLDSGILKKKTKEFCSTTTVAEGKLEHKTYLFLEESDTEETIRQGLSLALKTMFDQKETACQVRFDGDWTEEQEETYARLLAEVYGLMSYRFQDYKLEKKPEITLHLSLSTQISTDSFDKAVSLGDILAQSVNVAKDAIQATPEKMYPLAFAALAEDCGKKYGFSVETMTESTLKEQGFGGILSVGQGSLHESALVLLTYTGDSSSKEYTAIVGKGVTFDSGGYCLKPSDSILTMKTDMSGGASTLGAFCALAGNKTKANIMGFIPLCENLIGKEAFLPGCVIETLSKKTVEITNTDAEGRLILADGLFFATQKPEVTAVLDIATLTGASAAAFGGACAGVTTNNKEFLAELKESSEKCGEFIWELPLFDKYKERIRSKIADYRNSPAVRTAGASLAGMFLQEFVGDTPWIHIDIAGMATTSEVEYYTNPGATGFGVRLLYGMFEK